jgi:hypothetical protein
MLLIKVLGQEYELFVSFYLQNTKVGDSHVRGNDGIFRGLSKFRMSKYFYKA